MGAEYCQILMQNSFAKKKIFQEQQNGPYGWATLHAHVKEVGIVITNHTMREGDRGAVIIGSSVDLGAST